MGVNISINRLGQVGESYNHASQVHHSLQVDILQPIIRAEFDVHPLCLKVIFHLVSFLHRVGSFKYSSIRRDWYPYLKRFSSKALSSNPPSVHAQGWFSEVSHIIQLMTISKKCLPRSVSPLMHCSPFSFSLDALCHLFPTRQVLNQAIREDIYRFYIHITWTSPPTSLG
jgi:hypothetical protein